MLQSKSRFALYTLLNVLFSVGLTSAAFLTIDPSRTTTRTRSQTLSSPRTPLSKTTVPRGGSKSPTSLPAVVFDNGLFWQAESVIAGANALGLVLSLVSGSHVHLDLIGTGAIGLSALVPFTYSSGSTVSPRVKLSSVALVTWATKLAGFLFFRALKVKKDARLTDTLSTTSGTVMFWTLSWVWGVVCSLPHTLGTTSSSPGNPVTVKIGACIYVVGLIIETVADYQKMLFKASNPGQFCNVGLWSISQHPNFFGNLLIFSGLFVMNASALVNPEATTLFGKYQRVALSLLSPLFMFALFYGQASGSISNTVQMFEDKYGKDAGFHDYVDNVPLIVPNPFPRSNS